MEFIEAPAFTRHIHEYLDDDSYRSLQEELAANPTLGNVMPGTGGFRKMRWGDPRRGKGRRGGLRVIGEGQEDRLMAKRNIFDELMEGVSAMGDHRTGKITLRSYKVEPRPLPRVDSKLIKETRERLHCSRAVFARKLRINERTLEKWEQGRGRPNRQAVALVLLVRRFPDTLERLERLATG
jgi:putative transcriptional regulator